MASMLTGRIDEDLLRAVNSLLISTMITAFLWLNILLLSRVFFFDSDAVRQADTLLCVQTANAECADNS